MTKEEWKQAEEALTHFFHPVELKVDGYDITLILERVGVYQNKIMVYIGGAHHSPLPSIGPGTLRRYRP